MRFGRGFVCRSRWATCFGRGFGARQGLRLHGSGGENFHLLLLKRWLLTLGHLGGGGLFNYRLSRRFGKSLLEPFHAAGRINKLLSTREERVAARADFQPEAGFG